jgi:hypothetical protein
MPKIEIEIGGDNTDLQRKIAEAEILLKRLRKDVAVELKSGNIDLAEKMTVEVNQAKQSLQELQGSYKSTTVSTNSLTKATGNGSNTLIQFSRIAQDAPFGIMGIGNNITATAESFSYLSKSSGGAGNALKAVASSLLGTGGILLAVSLVTSALTYMSQNGITVGDIFDKLSGKFDAVGNSMKKAFEEGAKSAFEERGNLLGLISVAQSDVVSREARTKAVKDLQDKYPAYLGNLTKEELMYGNLTKAVNEITKALISKAVAEKLTQDAVQPTIDLFKANAQLVAQKGEQLKMEQALAAENKKNKDAGFGGASNASVNLKNSIANNNLAITETRSNIVDLTKVVDSYQKNINKFNQSSSQLLIEPDKIIKPKKPKKVEGKPFIKPKSFFSFGKSLDEANQSFAFDPGIVSVPKKSGIVAPNLGVDAAAIEANMKLQKGLAMQRETLKSFNESVTDLIQGSLVDTFSSLGEALGNALATGGNVLNALGGALLGALGGFLGSLGKQMVAFGVTALFFDKTKKSLFTGVGTPAAAVGLIAAGVAISAIGSAISATANKGLSEGGSGGGGGTRAVSTDTGNNSFRGSTSGGSGVSTSGGFQSVVFEISGNSLIGVLENSLQKNRRLGGNLAITS